MTAPQQVSADQVGRMGVIITLALLMGVGWFGGIAIFIQPKPNPDAFVMEYIALGVAVVLIVAHAVVPGLYASIRVRQVWESQPSDLREALAPVYLTKAIIAGGLLEGAALLNIVAYIITGTLSNIGMAGFLCFIIAAGMPMQPRFESWVETIRRDHI